MPAFRKFQTYYAGEYARGVRRFLHESGAEIVGIVKSALRRPNGTIYIFGNGGSYSIAQCFKYAIEEYAERQGLSARIQASVDIHSLMSRGEEIASGIPFKDALRKRRVNSDDLVILVSGSGDSSNLCDVAKYTRSLGVHTIGIIGSKNGRLIKYLEPTSCFIAPIADQQISEDILQGLVYAFERQFDGLSRTRQRKMVDILADQLESAINDLPGLGSVASTVSKAFLKGDPVWVLGLGHSALSACAEHTAHNLYWDGIYQVDGPPSRMVFSTPTAANLTGISNDRRRSVLSQLMGLGTAHGGIAIIFALRADASVRSLTRDLAAANGVKSYIIFATGPSCGRRGHRTGVRSPFRQAGISQVAGHILGRAIRLELLKTLGTHKTTSGQSDSDFLIREDLAQRRLIGSQ